MSAIIATAQNYWISTNALTITLNALGEANRIQASVASGAQIMCYIRGVESLGYDEGHNYRRWPLTVSPTYFNTNTEKYLYVVIPRTTAIGTQAMVWFPSQKLDVYGHAIDAQGEPGEQVGNPDYYYIWLQGIISGSGAAGTTERTWLQRAQTGTLATDEAISPDGGTWYRWDAISQTVAFLKDIWMETTSTFRNLMLGGRNLTGVAIDNTTPEDSTTHVATPAYINSITNDHYLRKDQDDVTPYSLGVEQDLAVGGDFAVDGNARVDGILRALAKILTNKIESEHYEGGWDNPFGSGFQINERSTDHVSYLTVDNLFVRMKAVFTELEIRKISYAGGNIIFSHAGSKIVAVKPIYDTCDLEFDGNKAVFSGSTQFDETTLRINAGAAFDGTTLKCDEATQVVVGYRCYLMKDDGTTATENWWRVDDQARCQTFNIDETGTYHNVSNSFYWRRVMGVGTELLEDGLNYDYVDLSVEDAIQGSTVPQAGDTIVQMGNRTDTERQGFISIQVVGEYAPSFEVYKGVNSYSLSGKRKICISPKYTEIRANKIVETTETGDYPMPHYRIEAWHTGMQCYYYDVVQHKGSSWLCTYPESGIGGVPYTTEEPSEFATYWEVYAAKGKDGSTAAIAQCTPQVVSIPTDSDGKVLKDFRQVVPLTISTNNEELSMFEVTILSGGENVELGPATLESHAGSKTTFSGNTAVIGDASFSGSTLIIDDDGSTLVSKTLIVKGTKNATITEHICEIQIKGYDSEMNEYVAKTSISIIRNAEGQKGQNGQNGADGSDGADGDDAVNISLTPQSVILTQNEAGQMPTLTDANTTINVKKGDVDVSSQASIISATPSTYVVSGVTYNTCSCSISGKKVIITAIDQHGTETISGETINKYAEQGYIDIVVRYRNVDTTVRFNFYCNLLGTWKREVVGDAETVAAQKVNYIYDPANPNQVVKQSDYGEYKRSSSENLARLNREVEDPTTGLITKTSELKQTADGLTSEVTQIKTGKNLLKGALSADGWYSENTVPYTAHPGMVAPVVDDEGWFNTAQSYHNFLLRSVTLTNGKTYVLSLYSKTTSSFTVTIWKSASSASDWSLIKSVEIPSGSSTNRRYVAFTWTGNTDTFLLAFPVKTLRYPQLELGSTPTAFDVDSATETSSRISQSADHIEAKVQNTGVDITNGLIRLTGGKVEIEESVEVPTVLSMNDDMYTQIQAGGLEIRSKKSPSFGLFQLNSNNEIILTMYDANGNCVVSLGGSPSAHINGEWKTMKLKAVDPSVVSGGLSEFTNNGDGTPTYQLRLGKTTNSGSVLQYFTPSGLETTDSTVKGRDNCVFTSKTGTSYTNVSQENSAIAALSPISAGWYVLPNNGIFMQDINGNYRVIIYQYNSSGRLIQTIEHQFTA